MSKPFYITLKELRLVSALSSFIFLHILKIKIFLKFNKFFFLMINLSCIVILFLKFFQFSYLFSLFTHIIFTFITVFLD
ncbi:unnamed protein product [Meloidogyne enterolobii]|uniref:Uncharacterized protein n=1 Tax=Meloidogyne enterolobii TaxID=390850 RepID=A0ACB0Z6R2_MELEN